MFSFFFTSSRDNSKIFLSIVVFFRNSTRSLVIAKNFLCASSSYIKQINKIVYLNKQNRMNISFFSIQIYLRLCSGRQSSRFQWRRGGGEFDVCERCVFGEDILWLCWDNSVDFVELEVFPEVESKAAGNFLVNRLPAPSPQSWIKITNNIRTKRTRRSRKVLSDEANVLFSRELSCFVRYREGVAEVQRDKWWKFRFPSSSKPFLFDFLQCFLFLCDLCVFSQKKKKAEKIVEKWETLILFFFLLLEYKDLNKSNHLSLDICQRRGNASTPIPLHNFLYPQQTEAERERRNCENFARSRLCRLPHCHFGSFLTMS